MTVPTWVISEELGNQLHYLDARVHESLCRVPTTISQSTSLSEMTSLKLDGYYVPP